MKINLSLPVRTDVFKYSLFPRTITDWNSIPLAAHLSQSTQSFHGALLNSAPPTAADHHDTPAVTGGLRCWISHRRSLWSLSAGSVMQWAAYCTG